MARGLAEAGPIAVRVLCTSAREPIDRALFRRRIEQALALRADVIPPATDAYRLIHGEGDRLPGLVCDRYGEYAAVKLDGEAIVSFLPLLRELLEEALCPLGIVGAVMRRSRRSGNAGAERLFGSAPPLEVAVRESGMTLLANLWGGQKTGLFLDHRETRASVRALARGKRVLDLYGYTGGFSVAAGLGGAAHVTTVDMAKPAIATAQRAFLCNGLAKAHHRAVVQDVPRFLEGCQKAGERYDLVIADPPNFAPTAQVLGRALASYEKLHTACCMLVEGGGLYLAASCSSHVRMGDFVDTLRQGARRARRVVTVLAQHGAPADHPRPLAFPEGDYLKVLLARID